MNVAAETPIGWKLVVEHDCGLRQERNEAVLQAQLSRDFARVVCTASAPAVERRARFLERYHSLRHRSDRDAFGPSRTHQGVVYVDEHDLRPLLLHAAEATIRVNDRSTGERIRVRSLACDDIKSMNSGYLQWRRRAAKCPIDRGDVTESSEAYELSNVVETALAKALVLAAEARRWDVVVQIAGELQGRRVGRLAAPRATRASR